MKEFSYSVEFVKLDDIIEEYKLDNLCATKNVKKNIAIAIAHMYYLKEEIDSTKPSLPKHIEKSLYRGIVCDCVNVIEAIEYDLGAKLLEVKRDKTNKISDKICRSAIMIISDFASGNKENELYEEYRLLRKSVSLSKNLDIESDSVYSKKDTNKWMNFMKEYLLYLNSAYSSYLRQKDRKDISERIKLLQEEINF